MRRKFLRTSLVTLFSAVFILNVSNVVGNKSIGEQKESVYNNSQMKGKPAPAFTLTDKSGNKVSLEDFKGKVVYLDIWASWCAPCLYQMKKAEPVKEHFKKNDDVVFLYVSIDGNENKWKNTIEKRSIKGVHLISKNGEEENIVSKYDVPSIPRFVLIDKEGKIADFKAKAPSNSALIDDIEKLL